MTAEQLAQYAGIVLSLALAYIPKLAVWYGNKDAPAKARIMGGLLVLVALAIFGLTCGRVIADLNLGVVCDRTGFLQLLQLLVHALTANQATFLIAVKPFAKKS